MCGGTPLITQLPQPPATNPFGEMKLLAPISDICLLTRSTTDIPTTLVDSPDAVSKLVDQLPQLPTDPPSIYIDLEGVNLSRDGSISILTLMVHPSDSQKHVYLINIHALNSLAFNSRGQNGLTLKDILESPTIPKVFFDVRNDSDALYAHFQISLEGIEDVQLMEIGSRHCTLSRKYLKGLATCIQYHAPIPLYPAVHHWILAKQKGDRLFNPSLGGSYEVFNENPLSEDIKSYCSGDVRYLPILRNLYWDKLKQINFWKQRVIEETRLRVIESQSPTYQPRGGHKTLGPWTDYTIETRGDPYLDSD